MSTSQLDREIRDRIDTFLNEIAALLKQSALESVRAALGDGQAPARRGPGRPRGPGGPRKSGGKRVRRGADDLAGLSDRLIAHVKKSPGQGITQIASALRSSTKELQLPVRKLIAAKKLKTKGRKRATKYFPS